MSAVPFTLNANAFSKCAPAISTNIKQCGSVTQCNAKAITSEELSSTYMRSSEFKVMEALFHHDMEIKMCEAVQEGLYDFMMANKVNLSHRINSKRINSGLTEIAPFIMARQYSPINNEYWQVYGGSYSGGQLTVRVKSTTNIPADVRSFPADAAGKNGLRVYIRGQSPGGTATETAWMVLSATLAGDSSYVTLVLKDQNAHSYLDPAKIGFPITAGLLRRGTPNVNDYEQYCQEAPAYLNWKNVPFWIETTRTSMCKSELYDKWRKLVLENNPLYREFFDLDDIEKNKQLAKDWQKRLVNSFFWNKSLPYQNMGEYDNLDEITTFDGSSLNLGVDGGKCIGKRANAVGIYEQLAQCGRIADLQGGQFNLPALFVELYNMVRVREGRGHPSPRIFDLFTDSVFAELLNQAFLAYYKAKSQNMLQLNYPVGGAVPMPKRANFGFYFREYPIFWPQGVVINVITHNYFDDFLSAGATITTQFEKATRVVWILDFVGIYPGILATDRKVWNTGDAKALAQLNSSFACVMKVPSQQQTLTSVTWTMVVECPASNLIIENFDAVVPEPSTMGSPLISSATSTTTTTPTVYQSTAQTYTTVQGDCPGGTGTMVTAITTTMPAGAFTSTVSQNDANAQALAAATEEAKSRLQCT